MGACQLRVLAKYTNKFQSPNIYMAIEAPWTELAQILIKNNQWDQNRFLTPIRKCVKVGVLAVMNGDAPGKPDHFNGILKGYNDQNNKPITSLTPQISSFIKQGKMINEILAVTKDLTKYGKVFNLQSDHAVTVTPQKRKNVHTLLSNLWASGESMLLTYIIQGLYYWPKRAISYLCAMNTMVMVFV